MWLITVTFQLLLINVAETFQVQVGTASLLVAVGSVAGIAAGLLMSVLSVRFNHKSLMLAGVLFTSLAAIGFSASSNVRSSTTHQYRGGRWISDDYPYGLLVNWRDLSAGKKRQSNRLDSSKQYFGICYWRSCSRDNCRHRNVAFSHDMVCLACLLGKSGFSLPYSSQVERNPGR